MSVIYITNHDEVIYDALKTADESQERPLRYKAVLSKDTKCHSIKKKHMHGTMGLPDSKPPNPANFLRKGSSKDTTKMVSESKQKAINCEKQAGVPTVKELREALKNAKKPKPKNFVFRNVTNVRKLKPREPVERVIDTRYGHSYIPKRAGLEACYIYSQTMGRTPNYLLRRIERRNQEVRAYKDDADLKTLAKCRYITRQERQNLLNGLKLNWEQMQKQYQLLPIITDTIPKILKKTKMEADMKQLEKDIVLIESHPYIYVLDDEE